MGPHLIEEFEEYGMLDADIIDNDILFLDGTRMSKEAFREEMEKLGFRYHIFKAGDNDSEVVIWRARQ